MSTSRSNTPPANPNRPNTSPSLSESITTLRPSANDLPPTELTIQRDQTSTSRSIPHSLSPTSSANTSPTPTHHPDDPISQQEQMAKRMKEESPETGDPASARSSPSIDSQGGTADTETDVKQDEKMPGQSEEQPAASAAAPLPKKKRTRTLTTPHQSAVLHALLAKSRFPTTAMREEVGRSIGLSARKVQIWFQNQRQKARRPKPQAESSRSRGAQHASFPSAPESSSSVGSFPVVADQSSISLLPPHLAQMQSHSEGYHGSNADGHGHLLGPGVPGVEAYATALFRARPFSSPTTSLPPARGIEAGPGYGRPSSSRVSTPPGPYGYSSRPSSSHGPASTLSRTLPPLQFGLASAGPSTSPPHPFPPSGIPASRPLSQHSSFSRVLPPMAHPDHTQMQYYRHPSPEAEFAYRLPDPSPTSLPPARTSAALNIPPPYALQPEPQWDNSAFNPVPRPSSTWSRPTSRSTREGTPSPVTLRRDSSGISLLPPLVQPHSPVVDSYASAHAQPSGHLHRHAQHRPTSEDGSHAGTPPQRIGRFDPIREAIQQASSPTTGSPPPPSPTPRSDLDDRNSSLQD
ncbi:hypothetical protein AX16_010380 [Volvariella volvacea WC 439]|nr:hypothetical protein AX16_010380 [Volvariella volvacea WC 439]